MVVTGSTELLIAAEVVLTVGDTDSFSFLLFSDIGGLEFWVSNLLLFEIEFG